MTLQKKVVIFRVDNSSSPHVDNPKNNFLMLGKEPTEGIDRSVGTAEKKSICFTLHCNGDESYLYVNKTEIYKFKAKDNISWYNFCLGSVS